MPGTQENLLSQTESNALGSASTVPGTDHTPGSPENRQQAFWRAALASPSLLLWIVTNLDAESERSN